MLTPPAHRAEGFNPLCGDEVVVYVNVDGDVLSDIRISGQGCSISQSSASLMSGAVKGNPLPEVRDLVRTFKAMMSIHEARLGDGEPDDPVALDPESLGEWPRSRGGSNSRCASSAPPCRGTRWSRPSTTSTPRHRPPRETEAGQNGADGGSAVRQRPGDDENQLGR